MFVILLLMLGVARGCTRDELEMIQIISLHGTFSPHFTYPADPNPASVWREGLHDLTMMGKFQAYALGIFLRNFYGDFITSDPRELEVISSSDKGAIKSAQSLVTALYTPTPHWEVVQDFPWQPIYIKYDHEDDKFLSERNCPAADMEHKRVVVKETEHLLHTFENLMHYWSHNSGMELKDIVDVEKLFSVLHTEFAHNLTIPEWAKHHWNEMKHLHDMSVSLRMKSDKLERLHGGPLVHHTIEAMRTKAMHETDPKKVIVYSTHIIPLLGFLEAMDIGKAEHLPPCTTVLAELYKHEGEHYVRYLYMNSTMPQREPQAVYWLTVPGCTEFCPLNYIINYTKDAIPKDWEHECSTV